MADNNHHFLANVCAITGARTDPTKLFATLFAHARRDSQTVFLVITDNQKNELFPRGLTHRLYDLMPSTNWPPINFANSISLFKTCVLSWR